MTLTLLALSVLPVFILLFAIYRQDKYEKEPFRLLLTTFIVGCFSVVPAIVMEMLLQPYAFGGPVMRGIYDGFVVAGFSEELCKLLLLTWVVWRKSSFNEYFDGIVYAVFLSLGFACVENVMYVFQQPDYAASLSTGTMRAVLSVPAHFLFAVTMGYHFSLAKFDPAHRSSHYIKALLYPVLLHGTYDALLMIPANISDSILDSLIAIALFIAFIVFDIKMWKWGLRRIRQMQNYSNGQNFDRDDPFRNFKWDT